MRSERRSKAMPALAEHLDAMTLVVERQRRNAEANKTAPADTRKLRECVVVMVWEEPDGSETITVAGDEDVNHLELKGVLHDGLYTMAHKSNIA